MGDEPLARRRRLIDLCSREPRDADTLASELGVSRGTVDGDLRALQARFPGEVQICRYDRRRHYHWRGGEVHLLDPPLELLDDDELLALITARGLLRDPGSGNTEPRRGDPYPGLLDGAIDHLLQRMGLSEAARAIAPDAIQISRFAARREDPATLAEVIRATVTGRALRFGYTNNANHRHDVHATPVRLINIAGEFHAIAWAADVDGGRLKQYRVSKMELVRTERDHPPGCPAHIPQRLIDERFAEAFRATGSAALAQRQRVVLAVGPAAWPHLQDRSWGGNQRWDHDPDDLPAGWRRLAFTTTGLQEARHWVLSLGASVTAEAPPALVDWLRREAGLVWAALSKTRDADDNATWDREA